MSSRFSRIAAILALVVSLWMSATAASAAPQQQPRPEDQKKSEQKNLKDQKAPASTGKQSTKSQLPSDKDPTKIGKRKINSGFVPWMSMSIEKEVALGREIAAEVEKQIKLVDDPVITEYVNRVGQNIVLHSDAKVPFTIKVVDSDEVNAFALPGGFFYVNKGLLLTADNEAELASAMAHEIAHVAARHHAESIARANLANYGMLAGIILGLPPILADAASLGIGLGFLKFNRSAESEADKLGVQYLYASGYDPNAMATMFEKLLAKNKKKPGFVSKLFATHPYPPNRRESTLELAALFPEREEYVVSSSEFQRVKARLLRLSNARATTVGDISGSGNDGAPGRPTLKRRQPTPDDSTTTPDAGNDGQSQERKPSDPPKLKRNDGSNAPATTSPPDATSQPKATP